MRSLDFGKLWFFKLIIPGILFPIILYHGSTQLNSTFSTRSISKTKTLNIRHKILEHTKARTTSTSPEPENNNAKTTSIGIGIKIILFASPWYEVLGSKFPFFEEATSVCPACTFTQDMALLSTSHAVVLHGVSMNITPPKTRSFPEQIWIWLYDEAPAKYNTGGYFKKLKNYSNFFNWTMTLRHDSDVPWTYGRFVLRNKTAMPGFNERWAFLPSDITQTNDIYDNSTMRIPTVEELKNRKLVAWISSNCGGASDRNNVVRQLLNFNISIDHYGRCGNFSCGSDASYKVKNRTRVTGNSGLDCRFKIAKNYKFYLALENSLCEDYVTEKYFDTLLTNMVPIVYGSANYSKFAPSKSFINVADFPNIKELAEYLKFLDKNTTEYLKYFEWRKAYWVRNNHFVIMYCSICDKLWNPGPPKLYSDIPGWYAKASDFKISGRSGCISPKEFVFRNVTHV